MRLFLSALLGVALFACADNPLSERVNELEQRLDEVEAAQEEDRLSLLARLDALAVTADNAEEIGNVRAKLTQTNITRSEFTRLANRVAALESQIADWSGVVSSLERSVYAVIAFIWNEHLDSDEDFYAFVGTGFAVASTTLVTNAHVIDGLVDWSDYIYDYNQENRTEWQVSWVVVQNLATSISVNSNFFFIDWALSHDDWDGDTRSPDVGVLETYEAYISRRVTLATSSAASRLKVGAPIATLGFPGELQGGDDPYNFFPIATFKHGTVSALRPRFEDLRYSAPRDTYIIQHNFDTTGGTSGSPIFDSSGRVVAINNAGMEAQFNVEVEGDWPRIAQGSLGFGIRADKIHEVLRQSGVAAKPTDRTNFSGLASRLDGRDFRSLDIVTTREELAERLAEMR